MYMDLSLLKGHYYKERKKLEDNWIFKQESKIKLLKLRKDILSKVRDCLTISEILGRADITEEVKDNIFRDPKNEDKAAERLDELINNELAEIETEEKGELSNAGYSADEYIEYICQYEKVNALESELQDKGLFFEEAYQEQKGMQDKG